MAKNIYNLTEIQCIVDSPTGEKRFFDTSSKKTIFEKEIELLKSPPVLLDKDPRDYRKLPPIIKIPEEADAYLIGENIRGCSHNGYYALYAISFCKLTSG